MLPPVVVDQPADKSSQPPKAPSTSKAATAPDSGPQARRNPRPKPTTPVVQSATTAAPPQAGDSAGSDTVVGRADLSLPANLGTPAAGTKPVLGIAGNPGGQTVTAIDRERVKNDPVFSVSDLLKEAPGVSVKQGNGPRDIGVSIRGSNARNGFGVRNIVVLEDGFPVTQPDGLSRTDLTDPHAYGGVDVWRGPSSALFGNYATGGAINFRTRPGSEINGAEYGSDFGSFNYFNNYLTVGAAAGGWEASLFASDVRGDGYFEYSKFDTQTVNLLLTGQVTPDDKVTFKVIDNQLYTQLPFRYSLSQYLLNPYQQGCLRANGAAAGCQSQFFSRTGNTGAGSADRVLETAAQSGADRDDRRTVFGTRWEHKVDADTTWRVQYVFDDRDINQPTGSTSAIGDFLSHNIITDVTHRHRVFGLDALYVAGFYWNLLPVDSFTFNIAPGPNAPLGLLSSEQTGYTQNFGGRAREEIKLDSDWTVVAGINIEETKLHGFQRSFRYNTNGNVTSVSTVGTDRSINDNAEEFSLLYRPNTAWQLRGRIASAYGVPQFSNLFVLPDGTNGNNTTLQPQTNTGVDLGFDWTPTPGISFSVTGFQEWFKNELVSQATPPGAPNNSFTFNAPASQHRGVEVQLSLSPATGWRWTTQYLLNDQFYTDYAETLRNGAVARTFDRSGNKIPGIAANELTTRLGYDEPGGLFKGLGAYVEYQWRDSFFLENANLLSAPSAQTVNLNVHYNTDVYGSFIKHASAFFEVRNVFDATTIAAANNISDAITAAGVQVDAATLANTSNSIYAGAPRTFVGGVKLKF